MDKTLPYVSVLMTAYNREDYINSAIESVLASTFKDFELIIVDDCSSDRTVEIASRYKVDSRVKVYVNEKNLGDYPNRNRAASFALGKYMKYLDSDDMIYPHGLEILVNSMEEFPEAALGLCRPDSSDGLFPIQLSCREAYIDHFLTESGLFSYGPSFSILRTEVFRKMGGFSGDRFFGDNQLWMKIAASYPVVKIVSGLVWYRKHEEQELCYERKLIAPIHSRFWMTHEMVKSATDVLLPLERKATIDRLKHLHARTIFSFLKRMKPRSAWRLYCDSRLSLIQLMRGLRKPKVNWI
jgi:glycosyltransferase involved in cell wall biosynthesis